MPSVSQHEKEQLNVYVPADIKEFVSQIKHTTGLNKSEFVHLVLAFAQENFTPEDIKTMAEAMRTIGRPELLRMTG